MDMTSASSSDRIAALESIEKEIASVLQYASQALAEMSKDKPANKQVEGHTSQFLKTLTSVETQLSQQILYLTQVSTGQAHEGSSYNAKKNLQMARHRMDHIKSRVAELEKQKSLHNHKLRQMSGTGPQQPMSSSTL